MLPVQVTSVFGAAGRQLSIDLNFIPAAVQGSLLGLAVYVLGVVLCYVTQGVVRFIRMALDWRTWLVLLVLVIAVLRPGVFFVAGAGLVAAAAMMALYGYSRSRAESFSSYFGPLLVLTAKSRDRAISALLCAIDSIASGLSSERHERAHFLREDTSRRVLNSPFMRNQLVNEIRGRNLLRALSYLDVKFDRADLVVNIRSHYSTHKLARADGVARTRAAYLDRQDEELVSRIDTGDVGAWDDISALEQPYHGPAVEAVLRQRLRIAIEADRETERRFVWRFTRVGLSSAVLDQRIAEARVRLQVDQPAVYDQYDRLRSEGEFRTSIAIPLGACIVLFGYILANLSPTLAGWPIGEVLRSWSGSAWLTDHPALGSVVARAAVLPWISWIVGLALLAMCVAAGRVKDAEAARLLYASIRQEIMKVKSTDVFDDSDVRIRLATELSPSLSADRRANDRSAGQDGGGGRSDRRGPADFSDREAEVDVHDQQAGAPAEVDAHVAVEHEGQPPVQQERPIVGIEIMRDNHQV